MQMSLSVVGMLTDTDGRPSIDATVDTLAGLRGRSRG
jgi:hypothetical protein